MKVTIINVDSVVGVDGVFRKVDLSDLPPEIHALHFDTSLGAGEVEYKPSATVGVQVRDLKAEGAACAAARAAKEIEPQTVINKTVNVRRENAALTSLAPFQVFIDRWTSASKV